MTSAATIRPATEADLDAVEAVLMAHDEVPSGAPSIRPGAYQGYLRHVLERGTVVVADAGAAIVGFGAAIDTGRAIHLADLFVLPDLIGGGIGRRLVERLIVDRDTFMATDPALVDPRGLHDTGIP